MCEGSILSFTGVGGWGEVIAFVDRVCMLKSGNYSELRTSCPFRAAWLLLFSLFMWAVPDVFGFGLKVLKIQGWHSFKLLQATCENPAAVTSVAVDMMPGALSEVLMLRTASIALPSTLQKVCVGYLDFRSALLVDFLSH